jgi:hypothetical protein
MLMLLKYAAPAMDKVDVVADATCECDCNFIRGGGGGTGTKGDNSVPCRRYRDDEIDELYKEIRQLKKKLEEKYPDEG